MTPNLALCGVSLSSSPELVQKVQAWQNVHLSAEQIAIRTEHVLHAGMYARTIRLKPGTMLTGGHIKRATMVIINGRTDVLVTEGWGELNGYNVIPASAGRKQLFLTRGPVEITMIFPTSAKTVEEAEAEFTDETDLLMSRSAIDDMVLITGE